MDRNTELLMWDEMTNEMEQLKNELRDTKAEIENAKAQFANELNSTKAAYESELTRLRETIRQLQSEAIMNK